VVNDLTNALWLEKQHVLGLWQSRLLDEEDKARAMKGASSIASFSGIKANFTANFLELSEVNGRAGISGYDSLDFLVLVLIQEVLGCTI